MISHVGVRVHAYVEKAAAQNVKLITVEDEKEREQEDHDAHVCYGLHGRWMQRSRRFLK